MMNYATIYQNEKKFLSLTSLYPQEFDELLPTFTQQWYKYHKHFGAHGKRRKAPKLSYQNDTRTLATVEDKLFYILVYLKNNPTQEFQAASFDIDQGQASRWINILSKILEKALKKLDVLPCQQGSALAQFLEDKDIDILIIDGMEQRTRRAVDADAQKDKYSGKKKDHTIKNQVISHPNQYVFFLSKTYSGKIHDSKIAPTENCTYPQGVRLYKDTGYLGYTPESVVEMAPFKKPRKKELSVLQEWFNKTVAQVRIAVEHAIAGIKRCRVIKERCRVQYKLRERFLLIATGLHNLRVNSSCRLYARL